MWSCYLRLRMHSNSTRRNMLFTLRNGLNNQKNLRNQRIKEREDGPSRKSRLYKVA